jgi:hypothetical protein
MVVFGENLYVKKGYYILITTVIIKRYYSQRVVGMMVRALGEKC